MVNWAAPVTGRERHKPEARAKEWRLPSLAPQACVACQSLHESAALPFGTSASRFHDISDANSFQQYRRSVVVPAGFAREVAGVAEEPVKRYFQTFVLARAQGLRDPAHTEGRVAGLSHRESIRQAVGVEQQT